MVMIPEKVRDEDGYICSVVYNSEEMRNEFWILDSKTMYDSKEPICKILIPGNV